MGPSDALPGPVRAGDVAGPAPARGDVPDGGASAGASTAVPPATDSTPGGALADAPPVAEVGVDTSVDDWDDTDDWEDEAGELDRTVKISGVLQASARATFFDKDRLPDGTPIEDGLTFQIEHTHLKFAGDLTSALAWEIMPCITHMNAFSVITANFVYTVAPTLQVTAGRFLLPFGQFNLRSLPGIYLPVSRPIAYASHEDRPVRFPLGTPDGIMFTPREDVGVQVGGNAWWGPVQLSYAAYLTNGLRATSNDMARHWDDNNRGKQFGGRAEVGLHRLYLQAGVGGSVLSNDYEDDPVSGKGLDQVMWGADGYVSLGNEAGRRMTLRVEYANMHREIVPNEELRRGDERFEAGYLTLSGEVRPGYGLYYQLDLVRQRTPRTRFDEGFVDVEENALRHLGGAFVTVAGFLQVKAEYGNWQHGFGVPMAHRASLQTVLVF
ncbi:MAG: hypothetical protein B7733_25530 [Myxococcales bacterium FL481]|nr:MAG: hypothetical protein B7733_25530 [Myxococcales bacterium FL481]